MWPISITQPASGAPPGDLLGAQDVELLTPAGGQGHALVLGGRGAGHADDGCSPPDGPLEELGGEPGRRGSDTRGAGAVGGGVQADDGMEVDRTTLLVFGHLGEGDADQRPQLGLGHADELRQSAVQVDGGPRPQPPGQSVPEHLGAGLVAAPAQRQVAVLPDLVLGTAGQLVKVCVGLAVPGRPLRSLVAEDRSVAGVRDRRVRDLTPRTGTGPYELE